MKSLTAIAVTLAVLAVASGKLPWILFQVRKAQIHLLIDSQASKWPKAQGRWVQSKQTLFEAIRSLHAWTQDWYKEAAANICGSDVTKLFHQMKEKGSSDSTIGKLRGDIRKVYEFGMLFDHIKGIKQSPITVQRSYNKKFREENFNR